MPVGMESNKTLEYNSEENAISPRNFRSSKNYYTPAAVTTSTI